MKSSIRSLYYPTITFQGCGMLLPDDPRIDSGLLKLSDDRQYSLNWNYCEQEKEKRNQKLRLRMDGNVRTTKNNRVTYIEVPEFIKEQTDHLRFVLPERTISRIRSIILKADAEWHTDSPIPSDRLISIGPVAAYVDTAFRLLVQHLYTNEPYQDLFVYRLICAHILNFRFWLNAVSIRSAVKLSRINLLYLKDTHTNSEKKFLTDLLDSINKCGHEHGFDRDVTSISPFYNYIV